MDFICVLCNPSYFIIRDFENVTLSDVLEQLNQDSITSIKDLTIVPKRESINVAGAYESLYRVLVELSWSFVFIIN